MVGCKHKSSGTSQANKMIFLEENQYQSNSGSITSKGGWYISSIELKVCMSRFFSLSSGYFCELTVNHFHSQKCPCDLKSFEVLTEKESEGERQGSNLTIK